MSKQEFLDELRHKLKGLPKSEVDERINFYSEMIDDYVEEGLGEEESIDKIGNINDISEQIVSDIRVTNSEKKNSAGKNALFWGGSPLWFALAIAAASVIISLYAALWVVIISFWAYFVSLAASGVGGVVAAVAFVINGNATSGLAVFGASLVCAGLSVFALYGCKAATKWACQLTKKVAHVKKLFVKKEEI